jgi:hypothetical protein
VVLALAALAALAAFLSVGLGKKADPCAGTGRIRPEWYFLAAFRRWLLPSHRASKEAGRRDRHGLAAGALVALPF